MVTVTKIIKICAPRPQEGAGDQPGRQLGRVRGKRPGSGGAMAVETRAEAAPARALKSKASLGADALLQVSRQSLFIVGHSHSVMVASVTL